MTEGEQLFAAVCADPADDAVRLVYADWLEEHGQPERAESIRVGCARARLARDDPREEPLRRRDFALRAGHGEGCRAALPRLPGVNWERWGRGFVCGVVLERWKHFRRHADAIFSATPVEYLRFNSLNGAQCQDLVRSPYLGRLLELDLRHLDVGDKGALALAGSPYLTGLHSLDVRASAVSESAVRALRDRFGDRVVHADPVAG